MTTDRPTFRFQSLDLYRSLMTLLTPNGVAASDGDLYKGAVFGRDSLRVGLDLVPWLRPLAETIIFSLAHLQSRGKDAVADATGPGQISHEARWRFLGPREIGPHQREILQTLASMWGGSADQVIYYGSADATPQFVRLVAAYCRHYGPELLDQRFQHRDGEIAPLRDAVRAAIRWTANEIERADRPLLGFQRANRRHGHRWQILQDGTTSIVHANGELANADNRVETIGLQGLAYDCLLDGSDLFAESAPDDARRWRDLAARLRETTFDAFWIPEERYFATAIDRDPAASIAWRTVRTHTAIPTELLETRIFDDLPESERTWYLSGIIQTAHGPEFMTDAGLRSRALRHADLFPYADYHGVSSCWGVANSVYAHGLARQGFPELARDVAMRHINALQIAGDLLEFLYVDQEGTPWYAYEERTPESPAADVIIGTNLPESDQGWTISFALRTLLERTHPHPPAREPVAWQADLTQEISQHHTLVTEPLADETLAAEHARRFRVGYVDREEAFQREERVLTAQP